MRGNMRAEVSLSCLLLAFEFGSRSEPEFVASTVRPACPHGPIAHRPVRGSSVHSRSLCSPSNGARLADGGKWLPPAFIHVAIGANIR
jgi:hypothetical protein